LIQFYTKSDDLTIAKIADGGALLIDKDLDWTSFDVVNKLRFRLKNVLGRKKFKVGHAGTLDPRATGLLIVCFGKATKSINDLQILGKEYTGTFHIGATTPTYDSESEIDEEYKVDHIEDSLLLETRKKFIGEIDQIPPQYSALKKNGVPMYKLAREGQKVKMEPRKITISEFDITSMEMPEVGFRVCCSKGTYIRSLAYDYGKALDSGAYLSSLRRTKVGIYDVSNAMKVEEAAEKISALML